MCQFANVFEPALGERALISRLPERDRRDDQSDEQRQHRDRSRGYRNYVSPNEFLRAITQRILVCRDRKIRQVPVQILRELFHRRVAPLRLLAHRLQQNIIEIAFEATLQTLRLGRSLTA